MNFLVSRLASSILSIASVGLMSCGTGTTSSSLNDVKSLSLEERIRNLEAQVYTIEGDQTSIAGRVERMLKDLTEMKIQHEIKTVPLATAIGGIESILVEKLQGWEPQSEGNLTTRAKKCETGVSTLVSRQFWEVHKISLKGRLDLLDISVKKLGLEVDNSLTVLEQRIKNLEKILGEYESKKHK